MISFFFIIFKATLCQLPFTTVGMKEECMLVAKKFSHSASSVYIEYDNSATYTYKCILGLPRNHPRNWCYSKLLSDKTSIDGQMTCKHSVCGCYIFNSNYCSSPIVYQTEYMYMDDNMFSLQEEIDISSYKETSPIYQINQRPSMFVNGFSMMELPSSSKKEQLPISITINLKNCIRRIYVPLERQSSLKRSDYVDYFFIVMDKFFYSHLRSRSINSNITYDNKRKCIVGDYSIKVDFLCLRANEIVGYKNTTYYNPENCLNLKKHLKAKKCNSLTRLDSYKRCSYVTPTSMEVFRGCLDSKKYTQGERIIGQSSYSTIEFIRTIYNIGINSFPYVGPLLVYFSGIAFDYSSQPEDFEKKWKLDRVSSNEKRLIRGYMKICLGLLRKYITAKIK